MKRRIILLLITAIFTMGLFTGCGANEQSMPEATTSEAGTTAEITNDTLPQDGLSEPVNTEENAESIISEDEAKNIALKDAGIKESDVKDIRVRLETDDRRQEYEVDFYAGDREFDYTILASDGTILEKDSEIEDDFKVENTNNVIDEKEAIKIVLAKVKGAKESDVRIHLDTDDGVKIYEGSIVYNNIEYDFEINAKTGAILEWERESVYDD